MLKRAALIAAKDLRILAGGGQGLAQPVLLGLLLVFTFSLARPAGELVPAQTAAAIFWLASAFALVLIQNSLFSLEEHNGSRLGLLTSPVPPQAVYLGKAAAGLVLLLATQLVLFPGVVVFLGQTPSGPALTLPLVILAADLGVTALGALLGALAQGQTGRESLLSIVLFPLLIPALLAAIRLTAGGLDPTAARDTQSWAAILAAFDALFSGAGLILFPFLYTGEE